MFPYNPCENHWLSKNKSKTPKKLGKSFFKKLTDMLSLNKKSIGFGTSEKHDLLTRQDEI